jgi:predicted SnoaL-like aldol condensation-catalyzing enzyme
VANTVSNAERAREALREIFTGDHSRLADYYAPDFVDHVNRMEFRGVESIPISTALPRRLCPDLSVEFDRQVAEGDLVTTYWTLRGTYRARAVRFTGVSTHRFEGERIIESWDVADSIETFRQLGPLRSILMLLTQWRAVLELRRAEKA